MSKEHVNILLKTKIYRDKDELYEDAIRSLLRTKPNLKAKIGIELYKTNEVSLSRASEIAGLSIEAFKEELKSREIKIRTADLSREETKRIIKKMVK